MRTFKVCFKCGSKKPRTEFYNHSKMADGKLGKCKACTKNDVSIYRANNLEKIREYDRSRASSPERRAVAAAISSMWRTQDARITKCHNAVTRAIRSGAISRLPCNRCGSGKSLAHHESYNQPLAIVWLCQPCHKKRHKEMAEGGIDPLAAPE